MVISSYALTLDPVENHLQSNQNEPLGPFFSAQNVSYRYDSDNRMTSVSGTTVLHDANGNTTAKGADTFAYDVENRLSQTSIAGVPAQYFYDGVGNRKALVVSGATKRYVVDTNGALSWVLAETDGSGTAAAYYVYGRGLISRITPAGVARYYHYDIRGSTDALSDSGGTLTDKYAYDAFGKVANTQEATANPFRYVGRFGVMDEGDGLAYIRARYFSPELGRFVTNDSLTGTDGASQSLNRYI